MSQRTPGIEFRDGQIFTLANQGIIPLPVGPELERYILYALRAHGEHAKPGRDVRKFDRKTPTASHALDCFTEILNEPRLSEGDRAVGALALLYHDVPEDTNIPPPEGLPERLVTLIDAMTYYGGTAEEMVKVWDHEPFVLLLKLYDKVSNWKTAGWMDSAKRETYRIYIRKLATVVTGVYGADLNVVRIAFALTCD